MIDDGYTCFHELDLDGTPVRIAYRPATQNERHSLFGLLSHLGDEFCRDLLAEEIQKRVLNFSEIPLDLSREAHQKLLGAVLGMKPRQPEKQDAENLAAGLRLKIQYPNMPSCEFCQKWQCNPLTGEVFKRGPKPQLRMPEDTLLCQTRRGCPKGTPQDQKGLSAKNERALNHYLECRAVGVFPDDGIVKRNARIISNELKHDRRFQFNV